MTVREANLTAASSADREPEIVESGGTARLHLTLAITDYDHVRDLVNGVVRAEGTVFPPSSFQLRKSSTGSSRMVRYFGNVLRQVHRLCLAGQLALCRDPGLSIAGVPPLRILRAQRPR